MDESYCPELADFWLEVGEILERTHTAPDSDLRLFDTWYTIGEEYRLSGRSPAALAAEILRAGGKPRLQ